MKHDAKYFEAVLGYVEHNKCDLFVYNGEINEFNAHQFIDALIAKNSKRKALTLFLTTPGGDLNAAYRMIRAVQLQYSKTTLLVVGPCKSAGTLIAVGMNVLKFGRYGELGPLDVQLRKQDEIFTLTSGLDTLQAFESLSTRAFNLFEKNMLTLISKSGGSISTKTASEVATALIVGLFTPLASQIDPHRLGEVERRMNIANAYAKRLKTTNLKPKALEYLIEAYPSHGFIIDQQEAGELFNDVQKLSEDEATIAGGISHCVNELRDDLLIADVEKYAVDALAKEQNEAEQYDDKTGKHAGAEPVKPTAVPAGGDKAASQPAPENGGAVSVDGSAQHTTTQQGDLARK